MPWLEISLKAPAARFTVRDAPSIDAALTEHARLGTCRSDPKLVTMSDSNTSALQSVVDQIAAHVLNLILSNELRPGQPVSIQDLASKLGVSNIPVREAMRRLEGRGLIQFRRGKRPQIAPLSREEFDAIYALRGLLEHDVARRSAGMYDGERIAALRDALAEFERIIIHGDAFDVYAAHARFHQLMLPGATTWDHRLLEQLWVASERYIQLYVGAPPSRETIETILAAHQRLLSAAESGDDGAICAAVTDHVEFSHQTVTPAVLSATAAGYMRY